MVVESPRITRLVEFCCPEDDRIVAAHTDSIQALLITASHYPELQIAIKGRAMGDQEDRIVSDPLFRAFTAVRAERQNAVDKTVASRLGRLSVDMSSDDDPFKCDFFDMNMLVDGLLAGDTNANRLLVNFGGATELEIGSNICRPEQLERFGDLLRWGVRTRQLGEIPDSILHRQMSEPLAAPSKLLLHN